MADFTIDIPINFKEKGGVSSGSSGDSGTNKKLGGSIKGLTKQITAGNVLSKLIHDALGGLAELLSPLLKILGLLFITIFTPLMPIIADLTESIANIISGIQKVFGGEMSLFEFVQSVLFPELGKIILNLGKFLWEIIVAAVKVAFAVGEVIGTFIREKILMPLIEATINMWNTVLDFWKGAFDTLWGLLKNGWQKVIDGATWIWDNIKEGFSWFKEVGVKLWEIIKKPFEWLRDKLKAIVNGIIKMVNKVPGISIPMLAEGGIVSKPTIAMIGEAGPEAVVPLSKMGQMGSTTININNPQVRNQSDIKAIASEVSKVLQRETRGRFSA